VGQRLRGDARPVVLDLHADRAVGPVRPHGEDPGAVHGVDRVVDEVRPHLVELAGVGLDARQALVVLPDDADPALELVVEDDQCVVQALAHVHVLHRRLVHVGVGLEGLDQLDDAVGADGDLREQAVDEELQGEPLHDRGQGGSLVEGRRHLGEPVGAQAESHERRGQVAR
jgi:hypothetical protein